MNPIQFHTVNELIAKFPGCLVPPSPSDLAQLKPGMCVKVGVGEQGMGSEAFWVELTESGSSLLRGIIVNNLVNTKVHGLKAGDEVVFGLGCVIAITD